MCESREYIRSAEKPKVHSVLLEGYICGVGNVVLDAEV